MTYIAHRSDRDSRLSRRLNNINLTHPHTKSWPAEIPNLGDLSASQGLTVLWLPLTCIGFLPFWHGWFSFSDFHQKPPTQHLDFFFLVKIWGSWAGLHHIPYSLHHLRTPPHSLSSFLEHPRFLVSWLTACQSFLKKFHLCARSGSCLSPWTNAKTFFLDSFSLKRYFGFIIKPFPFLCTSLSLSLYQGWGGGYFLLASWLALSKLQTAVGSPSSVSSHGH